ncbi:hypothetical protein DK10_031355 [Burkholderia cenocepacia]|nr:hypothetical protein DK10_031355 [Burkholderia cenocepacia]
MPAGAAHVPQGLDLCGSSSTGTILYIHTVFHDDPAGFMGRRPGGVDSIGRPSRGIDDSTAVSRSKHGGVRRFETAPATSCLDSAAYVSTCIAPSSRYVSAIQSAI